MSWTERAADRSPLMQKWRSRNVQQMRVMVDAARRLIAEKGSGFTTQELARESGVALQTFYRHFGGKDLLLLAVLEVMHAEMAVQYEEAARDLPDPLAKMLYYVRTVLDSLDQPGPALTRAQFITGEHWRLYQQFPEEIAAATQPTVDLFARQIRAAQDEGLIAPSDATQSAEFVVMLLRTLYHQYAFAKRNESMAEIAEHAWEFCLAGISGREGEGGGCSERHSLQSPGDAISARLFPRSPRCEIMSST